MHHLSTLLSLSLAALAVSAGQPACLLAAVNTQPNPADSVSICGSSAAQVQAAIQAKCGADQEAALEAFAETCKGDGVIVAHISPSSTSASSPSASSDGNTSSLPTLSSNSELDPASTPMSSGMIMTAPADTTEVPAGKPSSASGSKTTPTGSAASSSGTGSAAKSASASASASASGKSKSGAGRGREGSAVGLVVAAAGVVLFL